MTDESAPSFVEGNTGVSGEHSDNGWYFAEGIPGTGERPEFLDSRYKTVADQAKAYKELEKRYSATAGAPEDYELGAFNDFKAHEKVQELLTYAKENKLSQEGVNKFFETFNHLSPPIDLVAEKEKLGADADQLLETLGNWANNSLPAEDLDTAIELSKTAAGVKLLNTLRLKALKSGSQPPQGIDMNGATPPKTMADLKQEMITNYKKWEAEPAYRKDLNMRMREAEELGRF